MFEKSNQARLSSTCIGGKTLTFWSSYSLNDQKLHVFFFFFLIDDIEPYLLFFHRARDGYADKNSLCSKRFRLVSDKKERDLAAQEMKWEAKIPFFCAVLCLWLLFLALYSEYRLMMNIQYENPFTTILWFRFSFLRKDSPWRMLLVFIPLCGYLSHYLLLIDRISRFYAFTQH